MKLQLVRRGVGWEPDVEIYLLLQTRGTAVPQRDLEASIASFDIDLQGDEGVGISCHVGGHGAGCGVSAIGSGDVNKVDGLYELKCLCAFG